MKDNRFDKELDDIIRASVKLADDPPPELNKRLKVSLYQQEAAMQQKAAVRSVSLWYLPMIFNFITFFMLAVAALTAISNACLSYLAAGICIYIAAAGVLLTIVGVKRTNMKKDITVYVRKRGVPV